MQKARGGAQSHVALCESSLHQLCHGTGSPETASCGASCDRHVPPMSMDVAEAMAHGHGQMLLPLPLDPSEMYQSMDSWQQASWARPMYRELIHPSGHKGLG